MLKHYELVGDHLGKLKGYESYGAMQKNVSDPGQRDAMIDFFLNLQIHGTPEQCYERIVDYTARLGAETFTGVFSYAGMPYDMAEENMRLFASEVMPRLKAHQRVRGASGGVAAHTGRARTSILRCIGTKGVDSVTLVVQNAAILGIASGQGARLTNSPKKISKNEVQFRKNVASSVPAAGTAHGNVCKSCKTTARVGCYPQDVVADCR